MDAVVRILKYLNLSSGRGVMLSKHNDFLEIYGFTNADWAWSITNIRLTSRYFTFVGCNMLTWKSNKPKVVAQSSAGAEYRGMAHGVCELLWMRNLICYLGFEPKNSMQLYCNNQTTIDILQNLVQHDRTKHVAVDRYFIEENARCQTY